MMRSTNALWCRTLFIGWLTGLLIFGGHAKHVHFDWKLETEIDNAVSPDCMNIYESRRYLWLANQQFPGPTIDVEEGDTVHVKVANHHPASGASIHFHGMYMRGTPYSDGPSSVTQCALGTGQESEYIFEATPAGTHFWHAHAAYGEADGLSGPLIVRPKKMEPFSYNEERIIYLTDWYIQTGAQQLAGVQASPFVWVKAPNSLLINGKGIASECQPGGDNYNNSLKCLDTCNGDPRDLLSTIDVEPGKTYRFRIINAGQLVGQNLAIVDHNMTIVQVEGTNVHPVTVSSLDITPGQRYDVLVNAHAAPRQRYFWMETTIRGRPMLKHQGRALLQYITDNTTMIDDIPNELPSHAGWDDRAFGEGQDDSLKALNVNDFPHYTTALNAANVKRFQIIVTQGFVQDESRGGRKYLHWAFNNVSRAASRTPLIGRVVDTVRKSGSLVSSDEFVFLPNKPPFLWNYTLPLMTDGPGLALGKKGEAIVHFEKGDVFEFVLLNNYAVTGLAEFHPFHAHGHSFWVVGRGRGIYNETEHVGTYNTQNPVLRDTVTHQPLNWVAIRFVANNPGVWLFHCHINAHMYMGLAFSIVTSPELIEDPPDNIRYCTDQSLTSSSSVAVAAELGQEPYENLWLWGLVGCLVLITFSSFSFYVGSRHAPGYSTIR